MVEVESKKGKEIMKRVLVIVALVLSMSAVACARNVVLTWDQPPPETGVTWNAYRAVGECTTAVNFTKINVAAVPSKTYTDSSVPFGRLCYYVTSAITDPVEGVLESDPSNKADALVTPNSPNNLQLQIE